MDPIEFQLRQSFQFRTIGPPIQKPGGRIEIPLDVRTMPRLGLSALPLAFASLLIALPSHKHQPYHADSGEGDRAIIYLTDALSKDSGIVQFKNKKVVGRAGTGVFYKAAAVHRGRANRSGKIRVALALAFSDFHVSTVGLGIADRMTATFSADFLTVTGTFAYEGAAAQYGVAANYFWQVDTSNDAKIYAQTVNSPLLHDTDTVNYLGTIQNNSAENPLDLVITFAVAHIVSIQITINEGGTVRFDQTYTGTPLSGANISINSGIATVSTSTGAFAPGANYSLYITTLFTDGSGVFNEFNNTIDVTTLNSAVQLSTLQTSRVLRITTPGSYEYSTTYSQPLTFPDETFKFVFNNKTSTENFYGPLIQNTMQKQTALANIYGRLGVIELDNYSQSTSLSLLSQSYYPTSESYYLFSASAGGSIVTLLSDVGTLQTNVGTLQTDVGTVQGDVSGLTTTVNSYTTVLDSHIVSLSQHHVSLSELSAMQGSFSASFSNLTVSAASIPSSFNLGGINGYNYFVDNPLFPVQTYPYIGQSFASSSMFRPFQLDQNSAHFLSTSAYFTNNALMVTNPIASGLAPGKLSNSNYLLVDETRVSITQAKTMRVYSAADPTDYKIGTYTLASVKPFFSYTGCSYSINDYVDSPRNFSLSCAPLAATLFGDSSTVYVYGAYESNTSNSTMMYWAQLPKREPNATSSAAVGYQPEQLSYFKSGTVLSLEAGSNPLNNLNLYQQFVPLLPGEDWYAAVAWGSVTQYQSATGFGSWPDASRPAGNAQGSFTSLSFIGAFNTAGSYTDFSPTLGQFFLRSQNAKTFTDSEADNIFYCASTATAASPDPNVNASCSAIAALNGSGLYTLSVNPSGVTDENLYSLYGLVRGRNAWASITERLSISTANNVFSITAGMTTGSTTTPIYDALLSSLLKGVPITDIQPQENLSLVNNYSSTYWASPPNYWKIPSVLNPSNIQFNPTFSTIVLSQTALYLLGTATTAVGGFLSQVRANLDPGTFQVTIPPPFISFQFNTPIQAYSQSLGASLTTGATSDYAINFSVTQFDTKPSAYVDFYFRTYTPQINVSYSTETLPIGGGGGGGPM